ncbi:MAG: 4Fe-4S dicluster domain-containing protein [Planctomycetota bacterium]
MKKIFVEYEKCNGCRDCELACASYQTGTFHLLKRRPDGKLSHPHLKFSQKESLPESLIAVKKLKLTAATSQLTPEIYSQHSAIRVQKSPFPIPSRKVGISLIPKDSLFNADPDRSPKWTSIGAGIAQHSEINIPFLCLHCDDAPCLDACISGAMNRDKKTGLVFVNQEQCVGCWSCLMVCPFGVIKRKKPDTLNLSPLTFSKETAWKCHGCPALPEPACVKFCKPKALVFCSPQKFTDQSRQEAVKRKIG